MDERVLKTIRDRLRQIENEHAIKILYAVESGSRAWGFESVDSDYDVRFIYRHDLEWYLNVLPRRDVIEYPVVGLYDYSGWDLRKAMFLLNKSNPVLFEWLQSPYVYVKDENAYRLLLEISGQYFSPVSAIYHYLHMAAGNYRMYLKDQYVKVKKYFYVVRPLLACRWIEMNKTAPPMEFEVLLHKADLDRSLLEIVVQLLKRKREGNELGLELRVEELNRFIESMLRYYENITIDYNPRVKPEGAVLDRYFVRILRET